MATIDCKILQEQHHKKGYQFISEALKIDESSDSLEKKCSALRLYRKGATEFERGLAVSLSKLTGEGRVKAESLREKIEKNLKLSNDRIRDLEKTIAEGNRPSRPSSSGAVRLGGGGVADPFTSVPGGAKTRLPRNDHRSLTPGRTTPRTTTNNALSKQKIDDIANTVKKIKGIDAKLGHIILDQVLETRPSVSFEDVAGLSYAKQALRETVILPALKPELFTGLRSPVQGILLFGPPGNGKTMLAKAVAGEANCVFFNISASALTSKWVGEAEKLVKTMFLLARDLQPAIIFIDEVDSILCERSDKENEVSRRLKTEFLLQFDGVGTKETDRVLIVGATNRPHDLDDAVLRRFPKRIYVGLPDLHGRVELLKKLLEQQHNSLSTRDIEYIGRQTQNYSNYDLTQLAKEAAMGPLRDIPSAELVNVNVNELRSMRIRDFEDALTKIRPSCKPELLNSLLKFNEQYGAST